MYQLLARRQPPPKSIAVDASGFSHPTGGEWVSVKFKKVHIRRFDGLHNAVDTDTLLINAARILAMKPVLCEMDAHKVNKTEKYAIRAAVAVSFIS